MSGGNKAPSGVTEFASSRDGALAPLPAVEGRLGEDGWGGEGLDRDPPEPEGGAFADVEDLGGAEEGSEGGEVALEVEGADEAAQGHGSALAAAVAVPVEPGEMGAGEADGGGAVEEGAEGPVDRGAGDVEVGELEGAAEHGEGEGAEVEGLGELAAGLEA
jgi:hypothetical protein